MASLVNKPKADLTPEELEEREKHEFQTGPLSVLTDSVRNNTQVLINCRNNIPISVSGAKIGILAKLDIWLAVAAGEA